MTILYERRSLERSMRTGNREGRAPSFVKLDAIILLRLGNKNFVISEMFEYPSFRKLQQSRAPCAVLLFAGYADNRLSIGNFYVLLFECSGRLSKGNDFAIVQVRYLRLEQ